MASPPTALQQDVALAPLTTLGIGGPARLFLGARAEEEVAEALAWAQAAGERVFVLGGGSNVLVADAGFDGLVVRLETRGLAWHDEGESVAVEAAAGEPWDGLVAAAVERGLSGLECLSGIPGTVGAAPVQNIGAYGQELCDSVRALTTLDPLGGTRATLAGADCGFAYRTSRFKTAADGRRLVVLSLVLELRRAAPGPIRYAELERALASAHAPRPVGAIRRAVLGLRAAKSMLSDPDDPLARSAGSFFVNPTLAPRDYEAALEAGRQSGALAPEERVPQHTLPDGRAKVPAAWLIERSGFVRGTRRGPVGLSERHALAIVNYGGATAGQTLGLAREIAAGVEARFGVRLIPEPVLVGLTWD